jgi:hypothetical protein
MANLQERLRDVFSILETHNPHVPRPMWSLSESAVRVQGADSASDSEEDGDHEECVEVQRLPSVASAPTLDRAVSNRS